MRTGSRSRIGRSGGTSDVTVTPAVAAAPLERTHDLIDEHVRVDRLRMEGQRPGLGQGHRPEVVDEPAEDAGLVEHGREVLRVGRADAVEHRLDVAGDDRQRGPQLVAHVGEELATLALIDLEALDHRVEAAGEIVHRADGLDRGADADRVVAGLDPAGRLDESIELPARASERPGDGREDGDDDEDGDDARERRPDA